jgi:hypothetical protein
MPRFDTMRFSRVPPDALPSSHTIPATTRQLIAFAIPVMLAALATP